MLNWDILVWSFLRISFAIPILDNTYLGIQILLQVHSSDIKKPEEDSKQALLPSSKDQGHISVASQMPIQQSNTAVVMGQSYEQQQRPKVGEVRASQHQQQQQFLEQQPRKPGPKRGLAEEFLPPASVVGHTYDEQQQPQRHGKRGDVGASQHQQQVLEQQPRKAGPSRGLVEEFLPRAPVVSVCVHV